MQNRVSEGFGAAFVPPPVDFTSAFQRATAFFESDFKSAHFFLTCFTLKAGDEAPRT